MKLERLPDSEREGKVIISPSAVMEMAKSMAHYESRYILKEVETTDAMEDGKMIHKAVLEPETFFDEYCVLDNKEDYLSTVEEIKNKIIELGEKPVKGRKENLISQLIELDPEIKIWDLYLENMSAQNKKLISKNDYKMCEGIVRKSMNHNFLGTALKYGHREVPAWWEHKSGVTITMRMDFLAEKMGIGKRPVIIDLKTARCSDPRAFVNEITRSKLHIQAAMYVDGVTKILGVEPYYAFAVVEKKPPYTIEVVTADFGMLEAGRAEYNALIKKFLECRKTNKWPGYTNGMVNNISLPAYYFERIKEYDDLQNEEQ